MRKKLLSIIILSVLALNTVGFSAYAEDTEQETTVTTVEEVIEDETIAEEIIEDTEPTDTVSAEEFHNQSENLQEQIDEIRRLFEENGNNLNLGMEGINGEIDGLQMSLNDLYTLLNTYRSQASSSNMNSSASPVVTSPKPTNNAATTTTTATTIVPDTAPNAYLIEKAEKYPEERDFISVTTRDGHVFYIVIDYESEDKKVYFLNTVDTADLNRLLETGTTTAEVKKQKNENVETETKTVEPEPTEEVKTEPKKNNNLLLYIIGGVGIIVFIFIAKKKVSGGKKKYDDDESNNDDFTEEEPEMYINEDMEEDNEDE